MPDVVFPPLLLDILPFAVGVVRIERKIFLAYCFHVCLHLLERSVPRKAGLNLGEHAKAIQRCHFELLDTDILQRGLVIASMECETCQLSCKLARKTRRTDKLSEWGYLEPGCSSTCPLLSLRFNRRSERVCISWTDVIK